MEGLQKIGNNIKNYKQLTLFVKKDDDIASNLTINW